jgi:hypothetical protein
VSPTQGQQFGPHFHKQPRVGHEIPETDPGITGQPIDNSLVVGGSGNELLLEVQVEGTIHQFLIDSGGSLSLIKPGVNQAEIAPTDLAARGITGIKLKSLGI